MDHIAHLILGVPLRLKPNSSSAVTSLGLPIEANDFYTYEGPNLEHPGNILVQLHRQHRERAHEQEVQQLSVDPSLFDPQEQVTESSIYYAVV
jgi:hypothetical protein